MSNSSLRIKNVWVQQPHLDTSSGTRMESRPWTHSDNELLEKQQQKLQPPSMYNVILNNDDYTPMEFVIDVLQKFFSYDIERATQLMLTVHYEGKAVCGVFSAEVAETKAAQVNDYARENEHPLLCTLERA